MDINILELDENSNDEFKVIKQLAKALHKECAAREVPMFLTYCTKADGYQYKALLPGEFKNNGQLGEHPDNFGALIRASIGFNPDDYKTVAIQES